MARVKQASSLAPGLAPRIVIGIIVGAFMAIPFIMTFEYTFRSQSGGHTLSHWAGIFDPANESTYQPLWTGLLNSFILTIATIIIILVLLAPTMMLLNIKFPQLRRVFEFIALLPISIPAIVLVVGFAPIYLVIGQTAGTGAWTLSFVYGILVLPYAFRPIQANIDAINLTTLAEAARALGASWPRVIIRVLTPNLRTGLMAGSLMSVSVVLGEFTVASLLNRQTLQTALVVVSQEDGYIAVIFSLLALLLCFILLLIIGRVGSSRRENVT